MFTLKAIILTVAGWFIVPVLAYFTPATSTRFRWLDSVYGNGTPDTIEGDANYRRMIPNQFMRRVRWNAFRNPLNAWYYGMGPDGVIANIRTMTDKTLIQLMDGSEYTMKKRHLFGKWYWESGYNLREDWRINPETGDRMAQLKVGKQFRNRKLSPWGLKHADSKWPV